MDGTAFSQASAIPMLAAVPVGDVPDTIVTKRDAPVPGVPIGRDWACCSWA